MNIATTQTVKIGVGCLICGESVELSDYEQTALEHGLTIQPKVCKKCKAAILKMRKQMETEVK